MQTRRNFALGALALAAGCVGGAGTRPDQTYRAVPNAGWNAWVAGFRSRALAKGISPSVYDRAFQGAGFLPGVIERDRNQTEFTRSLEDYLSIAASDERISKGKAAMAREGSVLAAIEQRYGVDRYVVAAIWGLESLFGERMGHVPVISALSTLSYEGRRGRFFEGQLIAALRILQSGDVEPAQMTGSWAGAMGHTQFIPTSYLAYAVDFTGDGRRDIWSDDPADALASTANYLAKSGWRRGQRWGLEVVVPSGYGGPLGRGTRMSTVRWRQLGLRRSDGRQVPDYGPAALIRPAGTIGPAFLIFQNFSVLTRYNNAQNYVIGIGRLSDRLRGEPPLQARFPPDATGLTKADRQDLQSRLTALGFDTGATDGVIGPKTRTAIASYQKSKSLTPDGRPSAEILSRLRQSPPA